MSGGAISVSRSSSGSVLYMLQFMNVFKSFFGQSFMVFAYSFSLCGVWLGTFLYGLAVYLTYKALYLVSDAVYAIRDFKGIDTKFADSSYIAEYPALEQGKAGRPAASADGIGVGDSFIDRVSEFIFTNSSVQSDVSLNSDTSQDEILSILSSYGGTASLVLGPTAKQVIDGLLVFTQFGFCVSYTIFVANMLHELDSSFTYSQAAWMLSALVFPLCLMKSIDSYGVVSLLGSVAIMLAWFLGLFLTEWTYASDLFDVIPPSPFQIPAVVAIYAVSLEGIGLFFPVFHSMVELPGRYFSMLRITLISIFFLNVIFGLCMIATFSNVKTPAIILKVFPFDTTGNAVRTLMLLAIFFTIPFQFFPVGEILDIKFGLLEDPGMLAARNDDSSPVSASHALLDPSSKQYYADGTNDDARVFSSREALSSSRSNGHDSQDSDAFGSVLTDGSKSFSRSAEAREPLAAARIQSVGDEDKSTTFSSYFDCRRNSHRLVSALLIVLCAVYVPYFPIVLSIVGSAGSALLAWVIPVFLYRKTMRIIGIPISEDNDRLCLYIFLFGIGVGGIGFIDSVINLIQAVQTGSSS